MFNRIMIAETAYNVIQYLPKEELERLFNMLQVVPLKVTAKPKIKNEIELGNWTLESVTEKLLAKQFNKNKKNNKNGTI